MNWMHFSSKDCCLIKMPPLQNAVFRECCSSRCGFRFPDTNTNSPTIPCPLCGEPAYIDHQIELTNDERHLDKNYPQSQNFICILDNIRSVYNVGSIFRTMYGFGISNVFLCGITPDPTHKNFNKTSMGAEDAISWQPHNNTLHVCREIKNNGGVIISLESIKESKPINTYQPTNNGQKIALVVGNELTGIDPSVLAISDHILSIPIFGRNKSYNVTVAFGIGLYVLLSKIESL